MNQNNLHYFSDLKFLFNHILKYYILFIIIITVCIGLAFIKFDADLSNAKTNKFTNIVLEKRVFQSYKYYQDIYELNSQILPITKVYKLYDLTLNLIDEEITNLADSKKSKFSRKDFKNKTKIVYNFKKLEIDRSDIEKIKNNVKNKINDRVYEYKKFEYTKINKQLNDFLFEIGTKREFTNSVLYEEFTNLENQEKVDMFEDILYDFIDLQLNNIPDFLIQELVMDTEYKEKFKKSIENHFINMCQTPNFSNEIYCKYNKFNEFNLNLEEDVAKCEVGSANYNYKVIISAIIKNKVNCSNGYTISEDILYLPINEFFNFINLNVLLYNINFTEIKDESTNPIIIFYLLYSIIIGVSISILLSYLHSFYKTKK